MANPENEGRFLKDILRGVPSGDGLTRSEQTVRELSRISQTLCSVRNQLPASLSAPSKGGLSELDLVRHGAAPDNSAMLAKQGAESLRLQDTLIQLGVDHGQQNRTGIVQRAELIEQGEISIENLRALVGNSQIANALLQAMGKQAFVSLLMQVGILEQGASAAQSRSIASGQRATLIDNSRLAVTVLESLDDQGRTAYVQRLRIASEVADTRTAIQIIGRDLLRNGAQTHKDLVAIHGTGSELLTEAKGHSALLTDVRDVGRQHLTEVRAQSRTLSAIQGTGSLQLDESRLQTRAIQVLGSIGVAQIQCLANISGIMNTAVSVLRGIDDGIGDLNKGVDRLNSTADQAVEHLSHITNAMNMFVVTAEGIRSELRAITEVLRNPVTVRAQNLWSIGERCRQAGDIGSATDKFLESRAEDPSYYKNYYSLALAALEMGMVDVAEDFLLQAASYSRQSGAKSEAEVLHLLGKIEFMTHRNLQALEHLYKAYEGDPNSFVIWYDIALVEAAQGDANAPMGFLKALLKVAKAKAPGYVTKIKKERLFESFIYKLDL